MKHRGTRYRIPVNDFAVRRMERSKQRPVQSMEEVRDWERLFVGEIDAGRDPRIKPARKEAPADLQTVAGVPGRLLRTLPATGWHSESTRRGANQGAEAEHFGDLPVNALEEPAIINRFKTAQTPPLIDKSPFHRFGVRLNTKAETVRDRRISREEEKRLLDAALVMNTWEHKYVGPLMHDRIIDRAGGILYVTGPPTCTRRPPRGSPTPSTAATTPR